MVPLLALLAPAKAVLGAISLRTWLVIGAVAAAGWLVHSNRVARDAAAEAKASAAAHAAAAEAQAQARQREQELVSAAQEVQDDYRKKLAGAQRAAAAARTDRERLLDAVAAAQACPAGSSPAAAGGTDGGAGLRVVVGECAAALSQVAEVADATAARLIGLQSYTRQILQECRRE